MITPLHNHSEFSSLDGWSTVDEIADRCLDMGCPCCGLTDHGVVSGHLDFAKTMTKKGLKPIFGIELYQGRLHDPKGKGRDQAHLIALAMTDKGLQNLWALSSATASADHFHHVGRVFREDILKYREGLVFTSACALGLVPKGLLKDDYDDLNWYLDNLGDQFFIELSTYPGDKEFRDRDLDGTPINQKIINEALVSIGLERGCKFVYGDDGHYAFPEDFESHDAYIALQTGQSIYTPIEERKMYHPPGAVCMKDENTVRSALSYLPDHVVDEAIANAVAIGESANANLPEIKRHLPVFVPDECPWLDDEWQKLTPEELFLRLVISGIYDRYGQNPSDEVWDRVFYECETLINDGIHHYFLMGWDEIMFCDNAKINRGPGRGSSAGCIVAYALGITDADPIHYRLIFERFWNSGRTEGFPDIDSDFSQIHRQRIISYLKERWGQDKVSDIGTIGRMKPKSVCENLMKGFGISQVECNEIKEIVGRTKDIEIHGVDQIGWSRELEPGKVSYVEECVGEEIKEWIGNDSRRAAYIEICRRACSRIDLYGIHPSGVVISDVPIANELPTYFRGTKEDKRKPATQFPMDDVDKRMFVKLDVLGLRTLDTLEEWRVMMLDKGIDVKWSGLDLQEHPQEMWEPLWNGFTAGVFQVEDGYAKNLCSRMRCNSVDDLAAITALIRPGPTGDGTPDRYIARRFGDERIEYPHPRLKELLTPLLSSTYGLFVYQEDIINYFNALGYDLKESDAVRKILGKKKPEQMDPLHDGSGPWEGRGYMEMTWKAGIPEKFAQEVWEGLERFASYSFNKSHAVCYGIIGFRCAFAKYYGPSQFYAACLRTVEGKKREKMIPLYINEARRLDLDVKPPDIRYSQTQAAVGPTDDILLGFSDVKNVGDSGDYIIELRDRLDISTPEVFAAQFEELNKDFLKTKNGLKKVAVTTGDMTAYEQFLIDNPKSPKQKLNMGKIESLYKAGAWDGLIPAQISMHEKQQLEEELLGVMLSDCTQEAFASNAEEVALYEANWEEALIPFAQKGEEDEAFTYLLPGVVTGAEEKRGKESGKSFGIVTIEYKAHVLEFLAFNQIWKGDRFLFRMRTPGIFKVAHQTSPKYGEGYNCLGGRILRP